MDVDGQTLLDFRLHSEGSNAKPCWGIAFCHKSDMSKAVDMVNRPTQIDIEFPDKKVYTFGIRPSFWEAKRPCKEFVDAQVTGGTKPIKSLAIDTLGYNVCTKSKCVIKVQVVRHNQLLRIVYFK
jgi:hypothetical protein